MNTNARRAGTGLIAVSCRIHTVVFLFYSNSLFFFVDALFYFIPSCALDLLPSAGKRSEIMIMCAAFYERRNCALDVRGLDSQLHYSFIIASFI